VPERDGKLNYSRSIELSVIERPRHEGPESQAFVDGAAIHTAVRSFDEVLSAHFEERQSMRLLHIPAFCVSPCLLACRLEEVND